MSGLPLVVIAITLQALTNGLLSDHVDSTESLLLSFIAFGTSALVFGVVARVRPDPGRPAIRGARLRLMLLLNVATAVTFLGFYWSLSVIPAPLAAALETGIGPLAMAGFRVRQSTGLRRVAELGLGTLALLLALSVAVRMGAVGQLGRGHSPAMLPIGAGMAAVAGCSAAAIATISHRLGQLRVSPVQVTAHRFHLTYLLALTALIHSGGPAAGLTSSRVAFIATLAVLGASLPLFVLQIGMHRTAPLTVTVLASAVPGLTYLTAAVVGHQRFDAVSFALINASLGVAFLGPIVLRRLSMSSSVATPLRSRHEHHADLPAQAPSR